MNKPENNRRTEEQGSEKKEDCLEKEEFLLIHYLIPALILMSRTYPFLTVITNKEVKEFRVKMQKY